MDPAVIAEKRVREGMTRVFTTKEYVRFLAFSAHFFSYSYQNVVLLYMQDPRATCVAGLHAWTDPEEKEIPKNQKPLFVLYPEVSGEKAGYSVRKVFQDPGPDARQAEYKCPKKSTFSSFQDFFQRKTRLPVYQSVDDSSKEIEENGKAITVPRGVTPEEQFKLLLEYYLDLTCDAETDILKGAVCNTIKYLVYSYYDFPDANRITFPYIALPVIDEPARMRILQQSFGEARKIAESINEAYREKQIEKEVGRAFS